MKSKEAQRLFSLVILKEGQAISDPTSTRDYFRPISIPADDYSTAMAPPTESTILSTFLLQPASLPTIMTLKSFTDLFPRPQQSSPQIKKLYRDLQHQRARVLDKIASNIDKEVQRGMEQRRQVIRQRRRDQMEEQDDEAYVENAVSLSARLDLK